MDGINRVHTAPVRTPRTVRNHALAVLTSMQPGVCVPVAAIPLHREDALAGGIDITIEMMETHELLVNSTNMRVTAYFVPNQALDRFEGSRDQLDRSYMGQPKVDGGAVVPFFETMAAPAVGSNAILKALGVHAKPGDTINTQYIEAYNQIINMRLTNRSPNLTKRGRLEATLAPAFWLNSQWQHVVPYFDQAVIDGEVALNIIQSQLTIKGPGGSRYLPSGVDPATGLTVSSASGSVSARKLRFGAGNAVTYDSSVPGSTPEIDRISGLRTDMAGVYAELSNDGISVSLADIAMAKKAQWFAKLREKYSGIEEEYIIDMLMSGLSIPDQAMKRPILIADVVTKFQQAKRYATDYANMAESAVSGAARADFGLRVPRQNTGGVVMVMVECLPDQLFERQADPYLYTTLVNPDPAFPQRGHLPDALRDELDVQKVDLVLNRQVDVDHATPASTFGYEPMNAKWNRWGPRLGGKFFRPSAGAANDEVRQRVWAVEQASPVLGQSFYLVQGMHLKPFLDTASDPFEVSVAGGARIEGNTVFGGMLVENTNLYAKVIAKNPTTQAKP